MVHYPRKPGGMHYGTIPHESARTTEAVRRAIQHSQESLRVLAQRCGINQKTVAKWKKRTAVKDLPTGLKDARSTVLSIEDEDGSRGAYDALLSFHLPGWDRDPGYSPPPFWP